MGSARRTAAHAHDGTTAPAGRPAARAVGSIALAALPAFLLAGSALLNVLLFRAGRASYRSWQETRLDPLSLDAVRVREAAAVRRVPPPGAAAAAATHARTLLFVGDSRANAWAEHRRRRRPRPPAAAPKGAAEGGDEEETVVNVAVDGDTTAQVVLRLEMLLREDVLVRRGAVDAAVVQVGINDVKTLGWRWWRSAANTTSRPALLSPEGVVRATKQNLRRIVELLADAGIPQIVVTPVLLASAPPPDLFRALFFSRGPVNSAVADVNCFIRDELAALPRVRVPDTDFLLDVSHTRIRADCATDWLHLSPRGYVLLDKCLREILEAGTGE